MHRVRRRLRGATGGTCLLKMPRVLFILALARVGTCFSPCRNTRIRSSRGPPWMVASSTSTSRPKNSGDKKNKPPTIGLAEFDAWMEELQREPDRQSPIPSMPSPLFRSLAQSQLELLANSLTLPESTPLVGSISKIKSMALYLPQENSKTGQLEFLPAVLFPPPSSDRVFIASEADSGVAPSLPKILTKLPGFTHATSLIPGYPMISSSSETFVGEAEEVMCDPISKNTALSVPLFSGSQTVGVLLVWPSVHAKRQEGGSSVWTNADKRQVSRAAQSLSLALSMDSERSALEEQTEYFRETLSNSLHQVKNPLQALRTYGKLLQQRIANNGDHNNESGQTLQLLNLAQQLSVQSDRVIDLLLPMDTLVDGAPRHLLNPAAPQNTAALTKWKGANETTMTTSTARIPWANHTQEYSNEYMCDNLKYGHVHDVSTVVENPYKRRHSNSTGKEEDESLSSRISPQENSSTWQQSTTRAEQDESRWSAATAPSLSDEMEMSFIQDVLDPILSGFQVIATERGIDFQVIQDDDELPGITVAPKALQEAVSNVIDNALKYAILPKSDCCISRNPSPRVIVHMSANEKPLAPGVTILVNDNGPGILDEELDEIFTRGFRSESTSSVEGSGIGLDISRSLISRMGGLIQVCDSNDDENKSLDGAAMKIVLFRNPKLP